jgi:ABC-type phosphate transport system auxiliary subunit
MLGDIGSWASIVGVVVSVGGLAIALWQLHKLRGETRAARDAAEETRRAVGRDLAIADVSRLSQQTQSLKEMHRDMEWRRALDQYPGIRRGLIAIINRHPGLTDSQSEKIRLGIERLTVIESIIEAANPDVGPERVGEFNRQLTELQNALNELESLPDTVRRQNG